MEYKQNNKQNHHIEHSDWIGIRSAYTPTEHWAVDWFACVCVRLNDLSSIEMTKCVMWNGEKRERTNAIYIILAQHTYFSDKLKLNALTASFIAQRYAKTVSKVFIKEITILLKCCASKTENIYHIIVSLDQFLYLCLCLYLCDKIE